MRIALYWCVLILQCMSLACTENILAHSEFLWGTEEWGAHDEHGQSSESIATVTHGSRLIKGGDTGDILWYFSAPASFLGDKSGAYNGTLSFRLGFFEFDSAGADMTGGWDVVLESAVHGVRVGMGGLMDPWVFSKQCSVLLVEGGGWKVLPQGTLAPSKPEFQRLLRSLSGVWIRGGHYRGHEDSYIGDVKMTGPDHPVENSVKTSVIKSRVLQGEGTAEDSSRRTATPYDPNHLVKHRLQASRREEEIVSSVFGDGWGLAFTTDDALIHATKQGVSEVRVADVHNVAVDEHDEMQVLGEDGRLILQLGTLSSFKPAELQTFFLQLKARSEQLRAAKTEL